MSAPYRLGLLLCDRERDELSARFYDFRELFRRAFAPVAPHVEWQVYDLPGGELPASVTACDGYVISGSRHSTYEAPPWFEALATFITALAAGDRPAVGLCFGHQALAQVLGGEVRRAPQGWGLGVRDYETVAGAAWMCPPLAQFTVPVCHQDQVMALPAGARRLARSAHCENFVVEFAPHLLGLQAHPEVEPAYLDAIIELRQDSLPPTLYADARRSLTRSHDSATLMQWIARFLRMPIPETR